MSRVALDPTIDCAAASRLEPNCISYRLYEDIESENEFVFVEEWESCSQPMERGSAA